MLVRGTSQYGRGEEKPRGGAWCYCHDNNTRCNYYGGWVGGKSKLAEVKYAQKILV